ncbi:hypothetical protein ABNF65_19490 [Paenibacillus larvae]
MLKIRARQISPNYTRVIEVENAVMIRRESEESPFLGTYMIGWLNTEEELEKLVKKGLIFGLTRHKEGSRTIYTFDFVYPLDLFSVEEYTALNQGYLKYQFPEDKSQQRNDDHIVPNFTMRARQFGQGYTRVIEVDNAFLVKRQTEKPACIVEWICEPNRIEPLWDKKIIHNLHEDSREENKLIYSFDFIYPYELISSREFISLSYTYVDLEGAIEAKKHSMAGR